MKSKFLDNYYETLMKGEEYYRYLIRDYINCRSYYKNQVIFQYRDRGNKYNLVWDYFISPAQAESFRNRHSAEVSFYKEWLNLKTYCILQFSELQEYIVQLNSEKVIRVAQHNCYECYGICMILFDLLNRSYISIRRESTTIPYNLLRLSFFYSMTFYKYHLDWDVLKSVDILSNFARMHDYFGKDTWIMLFDVGISNAIGVKFMYIWAMQKSHDILPNVSIKLHYHTNARMMHQNQTVGGVTKDSFETPFNDCCKLGEFYADVFLQKYENLLENNDRLIDSNILDEELTIIFKSLTMDFIKDELTSRMQFLNRCIQIEIFDGVNIIQPNHIPAPIHYTYLTTKLGFSEDFNFEIREENDNLTLVKYSLWINDILGRSIDYSFDTYCRLQHRNDNIRTNASFRDMVLMLDENMNIFMITIVGDSLYPIKKDVDWTGLFYGIPCKVLSYDFPNTLYEDRLTLAVFGIWECFDNTLFNPKN